MDPENSARPVMRMSSQRLDAAIVSRGIASGREKAKELIAGGGIKVNGRRVTKPDVYKRQA